jgi:hypothetical protein
MWAFVGMERDTSINPADHPGSIFFYAGCLLAGEAEHAV